MPLKNEDKAQSSVWGTDEATAQTDLLANKNEEIPAEHRKTHVEKYQRQAEFPFEKGEIVWIVKLEYRAPLGEFRIVAAHPEDRFELVRCSDNGLHFELVEGKHLRRNP